MLSCNNLISLLSATCPGACGCRAGTSSALLGFASSASSVSLHRNVLQVGAFRVFKERAAQGIAELLRTTTQSGFVDPGEVSL